MQTCNVELELQHPKHEVEISSYVFKVMLEKSNLVRIKWSWECCQDVLSLKREWTCFPINDLIFDNYEVLRSHETNCLKKIYLFKA
jgi:hypothetical protein